MIPAEIIVLGIPLDWNSSYKKGAAKAPARIREALYCDSANMWTETGVDLGASTQWQLAEDICFSHEANGFTEIEGKASDLLAAGHKVISLGGDHSITYPLIRAHAREHPNLSILHLDAHPDLYDELAGNRHSHACPFARIMEEFAHIRLVQMGIRTANGHQREQAARFGVEMIEMLNGAEFSQVIFDGPVYLSIDLDCLDPAFAPGVSHFEPGGMTTRELLTLIQNLHGNLIGADIVEYNPANDSLGITAMVSAKILKEILGRMLQEK